MQNYIEHDSTAIVGQLHIYSEQCAYFILVFNYICKQFVILIGSPKVMTTQTNFLMFMKFSGKNLGQPIISPVGSWAHQKQHKVVNSPEKENQ